MQQLWDQILHFLGLIITPDWGSLVGLIPLGVAAVVVVYLAWLAVRLARAGPTRTGRRRLAPQPPPGTHLPGGSISPLLISLGATILLLGLVLRGPILLIGAAALLLAVLNWGREAVRDYRHVAAMDEPGAGAATLAVVPPPPPPGVHLPGPSFRPLLLSVAVAVLLLGLVLGPALAVAGALMLLVTLLGWLRDARVEYRSAEEADATGHVPAHRDPGLPAVTLGLFGVLFIAAVAVQAGVLAPSGGNASAPGGASPGASPGTPGAAAGGSAGGPAASGSAGEPPGGQAGLLKVTAHNIAFDTQSLSAPAGTPLSISFTNDDQGVPHNVAIHRDSPTGPEVWKGAIITGPASTTYSVPALAAGTYGFACTVHPSMSGTLTVR